MPIYEYQGQQYDIETTDHAEAKKKILAHLGTSSTPEPTQEKSTTSRLENMALQAQSGLSKTANMLAAGTVGAASLGVDKAISSITGEDYNSPVTDWLSKNIINPNLDVQQKAAESAKEHTDPLGIASTVSGGLGGMIPDMLMGSPLQRATATVLPKVGAGVLEAALPAIQKCFAGGLPLSTKYGVDRYLESDSKGNSTTESILAGLSGFGNMAAQTVAPMGLAGNLNKRVATGIAANVPLGMGGRALENLASPTNMQQDVYDPVAMATDAATGGLMHGILGARADVTSSKPDATPPRTVGTQEISTSLNERIQQLDTSISKANAELTRLAAKKNLSEAELSRFERIANELESYQTQRQNLTDTRPQDIEALFEKQRPTPEQEDALRPTEIKPDEVKVDEVPVEEVTLKPLDEIPDAEFNQKPVISEDVKQPAVKANLETTQQARASLSKQGLEDNLIDTYIEKITKGNVVEILQVLSGSKTLPIFQRVLANALAKTDLVKRSKVSIKDLGKRDGRPLAGEADWDGNIQLLKMSNVATLLHEVTHTVSMGMLRKYREGMKLGTKATAAVKSLTNLYDFVKSSEVQAKYDQYVLKHQEAGIKVPERTKETFFENVDEFLAYGTTNKFLMQFLRDLKYKKSTGLSEIVDSLSKFFGWNKQETTALAKLFEISDKIQQTSKLSDLDDFKREGTNLNTDRPLPSKDIETNSLIDSLDKRISPLGAKVNGKLFTAQLGLIYGDHPLVKAARDVLQAADRKMDALVNDIFGGTSKAADYAKSNKYFFTLKKLQSGDGLIPAVLRNSYEEIHGVVKALQEGHDLGLRYDDTLARSGFNENQTALAKSLIRMAESLWKAENQLRGRAGLRPIPYRAGWFPAIRRGDHAVVIAKNGTPYHYESFLSKAEADAFIKKNQAAVGKDSIWYEARKPNDNTENILKMFDDIKAALEEGRDLQSLRNEIRNDQTGVTTHAIRRTGMPGFIGSEIGLTPTQSGKRFADNIESFVREYAESIRKREIMLNTEQVLQNGARETNPNATKVVETMRDYSIGKTSEPQWLKDAGTWWKEKVDSVIAKHPYTKDKLDVHAWDRMSGFLSHVFYASTLTMRPAIWIAQTLTYFNSLRGLGRENVSSLQALAAVGESWVALARGKHVDPDLINGIRFVSQNLNTFHPQLTNQLNRLSFGRNPESVANQILHVLTGEKMSSAGDTVSRFMTWMTYYHVYKKQGLKGKELWEKAAEASDDNMFVYSKSHQPAIYRDLGIVGEQMSPLKTFAHGQLGLLVSDLRNFKNDPGFKSAVPLALTAGMAVIFGGMISAPIVAEYELLRKLAVSMGIISEDDFPSVTKVLLEKPEWLSHGLVSAGTGMDIGASMRYNSLIGNIATAQSTWSALFPASGFVGNVVSNTGQLAMKRAKGELTEADKYNHLKKILPKGPVWAAVDETMFDSHNRSMIPFGTRGEALSPQTDEARWAARLGSRSVNEAKDSTKNLLNREEEKKRNDMKAKAVDLILDGKIEKGRDLLIKAEVNPQQIKSMIQSQLDRKNRPVLDRFYTNKQGGVSSYEQKRKLLEMAGYLEQRND